MCHKEGCVEWERERAREKERFGFERSMSLRPAGQPVGGGTGGGETRLSHVLAVGWEHTHAAEMDVGGLFGRGKPTRVAPKPPDRPAPPPPPPGMAQAVIPDGATAGQTFQARLPDGRMVSVMVPRGSKSGDALNFTPHVQTPPPPPSTVTSDTLQVIVPPGVGPGQHFMVTDPRPGGTKFQVTVPQGLGPGSTLTVTPPPPVAIPVAITVDGAKQTNGETRSVTVLQYASGQKDVQVGILKYKRREHRNGEKLTYSIDKANLVLLYTEIKQLVNAKKPAFVYLQSPGEKSEKVLYMKRYKPKGDKRGPSEYNVVCKVAHDNLCGTRFTPKAIEADALYKFATCCSHGTVWFSNVELKN